MGRVSISYSGSTAPVKASNLIAGVSNQATRTPLTHTDLGANRAPRPAIDPEKSAIPTDAEQDADRITVLDLPC